MLPWNWYQISTSCSLYHRRGYNKTALFALFPPPETHTESFACAADAGGLLVERRYTYNGIDRILQHLLLSYNAPQCRLLHEQSAGQQCLLYGFVIIIYGVVAKVPLSQMMMAMVMPVIILMCENDEWWMGERETDGERLLRIKTRWKVFFASQ